MPSNTLSKYRYKYRQKIQRIQDFMLEFFMKNTNYKYTIYFKLYIYYILK